MKHLLIIALALPALAWSAQTPLQCQATGAEMTSNGTMPANFVAISNTYVRSAYPALGVYRPVAVELYSAQLGQAKCLKDNGYTHEQVMHCVQYAHGPTPQGSWLHRERMEAYQSIKKGFNTDDKVAIALAQLQAGASAITKCMEKPF